MTDLVLTVRECAKVLKISEATLRRNYLCRPDFPKIQVEGSRRIIIPKKALESWLNQQIEKNKVSMGL